jgi:hypothetical protein
MTFAIIKSRPVSESTDIARFLNERTTAGFRGLGAGCGAAARIRETKSDISISEHWMTVCPLGETEVSLNEMVDGSIGFP